jgi:hypothetical protein
MGLKEVARRIFVEERVTTQGLYEVPGGKVVAEFNAGRHKLGTPSHKRIGEAQIVESRVRFIGDWKNKPNQP